MDIYRAADAVVSESNLLPICAFDLKDKVIVGVTPLKDYRFGDTAQCYYVFRDDLVEGPFTVMQIVFEYGDELDICKNKVVFKE